MPWPIVTKTFGELYRRFVADLDPFQNVRVIDTADIVPKIDPGNMYTYQMRVYNPTTSSSFTNCRPKLSFNTPSLWMNVSVETTLCWQPNKGSVTINRGDHEWLNLATIRPVQEGKIWGNMPDAEIIFPTEAGILNPATVSLTPSKSDQTSIDKVTRRSLPVFPALSIYTNGDLKISSKDHPPRYYDLWMSYLDDDVYVSVGTYRKRKSSKLVKYALGLPDSDKARLGDSVPISDVNNSLK